FYDDSLKLERTFRYDCGIGNSLLSEKQKDTITRCSRTEQLADATERRIEETRDEKGRIRRIIYTSNKSTGYSKTESYDEKNRLVYTYERTRMDNKVYDVVTKVYRRGKLRTTRHYRESKDALGFYQSK